ncbi:MAG: nucleotide exchange factor GrpE [Candidatus Beckwithbacteria bacterium]|nr:nucleotide exchange factor GrpE [Candidatus Beckwithbacteria bacterium]
MSKKTLENQLKRTLADYQNLTKRVEADKQEFVKFVSASLIAKLLPILDDLERAQEHLKNAGLQLTIDKFKSVLQAEGVSEIKLLNTVFDPKTAECSELVAGQPNLILAVVQPGFYLHDRVLRPARVKVGKDNINIIKEDSRSKIGDK